MYVTWDRCHFFRVTATNLAMIEVTNRKIWYEGKSLAEPSKKWWVQIVEGDFVMQHAYFTRLFLSIFLSFFLSQYQVLSTYTSKCNFTDSHTKNKVFAALKLMELRNAPQNFVLMPDTKLYPNREVNVENKLKGTIKPLRKIDWLKYSRIDHKTYLKSCGICYMFRHLGSVKGLFSNNSS